MLGEISDTVQIRAHGMLRVVPELQVFPHALAEWGHGLAPRGHTSTPSRQKGEHGGVTRGSHHPRRGNCGEKRGAGGRSRGGGGGWPDRRALLPERSEWFRSSRSMLPVPHLIIQAFSGSSAAWVVWYPAPLTPTSTQASQRQKSTDSPQALLCVPGHGPS